MNARHFSTRFWSVLALAFLIAFATRMTSARAQDANPEVLAKVTKLNKKALDAYQKRDYEAARGFLKEALDICASSNLDNHPIKARTHIHLGVVMIAGFKQRESGIKHFKKALQIQPDIQLTKSLVTPQLQDAFEEAMVGSGESKQPEQAAATPAEGGGDAEGAPAGAEGGGDEAPSRRRPPPRKKHKKHSDDDEGDDDKGDDEEHAGGNNAGKIFVGLTLGGGFGIASGTGELASTKPHTLANAGFAPAQLLHISPEVGYFLSSNLLLSVQGRYQIITGENPGPTTCGANPCSKQTSAIAVFARATYFMGDGDFHTFIGGSLGGGTIRHVSNFPADTSCGMNNQTCVDTLKAGPLLVGPFAGLAYDLGSTASLILALNTQLGVPKFTFNLDVNAGLGLRF
jgi:hypothetical protein